MLTKQITPKLLEKYEFPEDGVDRQIWEIARQKVMFDFLEKQIVIAENIGITFQEMETLHKIMKREEVDV